MNAALDVSVPDAFRSATTRPQPRNGNNRARTLSPVGHVGILCRISDDKTGRAESVEDQERWGRGYSAETFPGLPVVVYSDNDITAAKDGVVRPGFERLRQAIRDGQCVQVVATWQSRTTRLEKEWFEFAAEMMAAGITKLHTRHDGIVDVDGLLGGILAVLNAYEVRQMKKRLADKLDANAERGVPPGSKGFGYEHGKNENGERTYVQVPEQAKAILFAADKLLNGWALAKIAAHVDKQGIRGAHRAKVRNAEGLVLLQDGRWVAKDDPGVKAGLAVTRETRITAGSVRSWLTNPTVAGFLVHRGVIVGKGNWEPILPEDSWKACRAKLSAPRVIERSDGKHWSVTTNHSGFPGQAYLLTGGLARCGVCGAAMRGQKLQAAKGKPYLLCARRKDGDRKGACTAIMLPETEAFVVGELFGELDKPEFLELVAADDNAERRDQITAALEGIDGQRAELAALWGKHALTSSEWQAARSALLEQERALQAELRAIPRPPARADIERARDGWALMTLDEKRAFLRMFIDTVTVAKARPGLKFFDDSRVGITWHTETINAD